MAKNQLIWDADIWAIQAKIKTIDENDSSVHAYGRIVGTEWSGLMAEEACVGG